jgi:uncharacterized protein UPF0547
MKTCPSCGSEVAEDALECLCGYSFEAEAEMDDSLIEPEDGEGVAGEGEEALDAAAPEDEGGDFNVSFDREVPTTKRCVFCGSEIAIQALRCAHCSAFLPIAEGAIFKQYFFFLFASLAITVGTLLPWERAFLKGNLTGADSIGGGFLLVFGIYGMIVSVWNIYHRKMIVWPVMLAALDGVVLAGQRIYQLSTLVSQRLGTEDLTVYSPFNRFRYIIKEYAQSYGPGLYLVAIFSVLVLFSVVMGVFAGAKQDARRKAEEREMRAASRKPRRS